MCWRNAKYNTIPGLTEVISSPDKPEVVHSISRVQVCVQSCLYMHMYINMHVHACVGEGEEEVPNMRT